MAELADALGLNPRVARRAGSSPAPGTVKRRRGVRRAFGWWGAGRAVSDIVRAVTGWVSYRTLSVLGGRVPGPAVSDIVQAATGWVWSRTLSVLGGRVQVGSFGHCPSRDRMGVESDIVGFGWSCPGRQFRTLSEL